MAKFFEPFPTITYNGVACKNITKRTALTRDVRNNFAAFYNFELQDGNRPDIVAHQVYGDQYFDWVVYYANQIVDPYHGWCLSQDEFTKYIINKYNSIAEATERINHYRVKVDDATLTVAAFEVQTPGRKKYWTPVYDDAYNILFYKRVNVDWKINTNSMVRLVGTLTNTTTADFTVGEHVTQVSGGVVVAAGDVVRCTSTTLELINISGTFSVGQVTGSSSDTVASIGEVEVVGVTIPEDELSFWEPVSFYEYEYQLNEDRRDIKMIVPNIAAQIVGTHKDLVNE